jgi:transposase-like protein
MNSQENGSLRRERRHFSAAQKAAIVKAHLIDRTPISDLCEQYQITVNQFYQWQKQLFEGAAAAFETRRKSGAPDAKDRRIDALEAKLANKNEVISELMEECVLLKKLDGRS